jgi:steroid 5-alpha reductase family enzyme
MFEWQAWWPALVLLLGMGVLTWLLSIPLRNVSIVDSLWSLLIAAAGICYALEANTLTTRSWLVLALLIVWALRLSLYITVRNHGAGEDRRYQAIRARNEPHFAFKSLYLVFGLQAALAWIVSLPLLAALRSTRALGWVDYVGALAVLTGLLWETVGDAQLARFKADPANRGQVMDRGLWRFSRHPNYFGECCVWWGFFFIALSCGGWWAMVSPVLMTLLLLKVSGVGLLEKDIAERRPAYHDYVARTNAFLPWIPKVPRQQEPKS